MTRSNPGGYKRRERRFGKLTPLAMHPIFLLLLCVLAVARAETLIAGVDYRSVWMPLEYDSLLTKPDVPVGNMVRVMFNPQTKATPLTLSKLRVWSNWDTAADTEPFFRPWDEVAHPALVPWGAMTCLNPPGPHISEPFRREGWKAKFRGSYPETGASLAHHCWAACAGIEPNCNAPVNYTDLVRSKCSCDLDGRILAKPPPPIWPGHPLLLLAADVVPVPRRESFQWRISSESPAQILGNSARGVVVHTYLPASSVGRTVRWVMIPDDPDAEEPPQEITGEAQIEEFIPRPRSGCAPPAPDSADPADPSCSPPPAPEGYCPGPDGWMIACGVVSLGTLGGSLLFFLFAVRRFPSNKEQVV